jgi:hypothetical protein
MHTSSGDDHDLMDRVRRFYDAYHQHRERQPDERMKRVYWGQFRGDVLEVGGGQRIPTGTLSEMRSYVMVDVSIYAVQSAINRGITAVHVTGEDLPFPDRSFDTVACCEVIEHIVDPALTIREMCRTSRGAVIVMGPNYFGTKWMPGIDRYIPVRLLRCIRGDHKRPYRLVPHLTYDEKWGPDADAVSACNAWWVAQQIRQAGFQITELDTWSFVNCSTFNKVPWLCYLGPYQVIVGRRSC